MAIRRLGAAGVAGTAPVPAWRVRGEWSGGVSDYAVGDVVYYRGATYVCKVASGAPPTELLAPASATDRNFETSIGSWGDPSANYSAMTRDTTQFHSGVASLKMLKQSGTSYSYTKNMSYQVNIVSGTAYTFSCWARSEKLVSVELINSIGGNAPSVPMPVRNTWTYISWTFTAPSSGASDLLIKELYVATEALNAGESWWLDDITFYAAPGFNPTDWDLIAPAGPPAYTTALRPAATAVPTGTALFDTTLVKPIWSNGTVWKDATGTTV